MENEGYIKLYRSLPDKPIWQLSTPGQKTVLITLLLMVNHKEAGWEWQGRKFNCKPGQVVTSLEKITRRAGKGISVQHVRTALARFEKYGFLTNESAKTGRLITICNWDCYQQAKSGGDKESRKGITKPSQSGGKDLTTNKNDKNDKNEKNDKEKESSYKYSDSSLSSPGLSPLPSPCLSSFPLPSSLPVSVSPCVSSGEDKAAANAKNWRDDFGTYLDGLRKAYDALMSDEDLLNKMQRYHPNVDIRLSVEKACVEFWSLEAGWKNKKKTRSQAIDWQATFRNALNIQSNRVYTR